MDWFSEMSWWDRALLGGLVAVIVNCQIQTMLAVRSIDKNLADAINRFAKLVPREREDRNQ